MNRKALLDRLVENWPAKIICLTLSLLLFLFYRISTLEQRFFSVPLVVQNSGDLVPAVNYPRMVRISLRGESNSIHPIIEDDVVAYIDLSGYTREGEYRIPVRTRLKGTALDVDPLEISVEPSELPLRLEYRVVRKIEIVPAFRGYPEAGFEFSGYTLNPSVVEVAGPRTFIEKISDVTTDSIDLSARNSSFSGVIRLINPNPLLVLGGEGRSEFNVVIEETTLIRTFEDVPFHFENLNDSYAVETDLPWGTIQLKGTQNNLANIELPQNALTVFAGNITGPGIYILPVYTMVSDPYEVLRSWPTEIRLTVTRREP